MKGVQLGTNHRGIKKNNGNNTDADYTFMDEKEFLELNEYGTPSGRHRSSSSNGNS